MVLSAFNAQSLAISCMDYLREGDELYLYSLCRLARNSKELLDIKDALDKKKVVIKSLEFNIDTSNPVGVMFYQFYAAILEFQRRWISDRTVDGLAAAKLRNRGGFKGRLPKLKQKQRDMLLDMYNSRKYSYEQMAEAFKISRTTVYNMIKSHIRPDENPDNDSA